MLGEKYLLLSPQGGAWLCQEGHLAEGCLKAAGMHAVHGHIQQPLSKGPGAAPQSREGRTLLCC